MGPTGRPEPHTPNSPHEGKTYFLGLSRARKMPGMNSHRIHFFVFVPPPLSERRPGSRADRKRICNKNQSDHAKTTEAGFSTFQI
jgi:hypothetical protein